MDFPREQLLYLYAGIRKKRLTRHDGDNAGEPYGVVAQGLSPKDCQ